MESCYHEKGDKTPPKSNSHTHTHTHSNEKKEKQKQEKSNKVFDFLFSRVVCRVQMYIYTLVSDTLIPEKGHDHDMLDPENTTRRGVYRRVERHLTFNR